MTIAGTAGARVRHAEVPPFRRPAMLLGAFLLVLTACAGSASDGAGGTESSPTTAASGGADPATLESSAGEPRRVLERALRPTSDIATNPLPDLVVADVGQGRSVNIRNVFPAERPVLLWMWAPY